MNYTDKAINGYLPTYLDLANKIGTQGSVLELGIDQGGSLELWLSLFPDGVVVGVDHNPDVVVPKGTYSCIMAQDNPKLPEALQEWAPFNLIVDDASHQAGPTLRSLRLLWPLVIPGGWYVIEDWGVAFRHRAPMYEPEMLDVARDLIIWFGNPNPSVASITYKPGLIILEKVT